MLLAAVGIGIGAYPLMRYAGAALAALPGDPVAQATFAVAQGIATPVEIARLASLADRDPLAARGLAIHARRLGDLARADALYQQLLAGGADDVSAQNNAADVQLALGHTERAIELYGSRRAASRRSCCSISRRPTAGRSGSRSSTRRSRTRSARAASWSRASRRSRAASAGGFVADLPPAPSLFWSRALALGGRRRSRAGVPRPFRARAGSAATRACSAPPRRRLVLLGGSCSPRGSIRRARAAAAASASAGAAIPRGADRTSSATAATRCSSRPRRPTARCARARVNELRAREERIGRVHTIALAARAGRGRACSPSARCAAGSARSASRSRSRRSSGATASCPIPLRRGRGRADGVPRHRSARRDRLYAIAVATLARRAEAGLVSAGLSGNLSDFGIADVFQLIGQQRKTGTLELRSGTARAQLAFDRGLVVSAGIDGERARRPRSARGSAGPLRAAHARARRRGGRGVRARRRRPLARTLVARGWLDARDRARARRIS